MREAPSPPPGTGNVQDTARLPARGQARKLRAFAKGVGVHRQSPQASRHQRPFWRLLLNTALVLADGENPDPTTYSNMATAVTGAEHSSIFPRAIV